MYGNHGSRMRKEDAQWNSFQATLKTVDKKSFERRNFLVLRPVLLKNAYFSSANRQLSIDVQHVELR